MTRRGAWRWWPTRRRCRASMKAAPAWAVDSAEDSRRIAPSTFVPLRECVSRFLSGRRSCTIVDGGSAPGTRTQRGDRPPKELQNLSSASTTYESHYWDDSACICSLSSLSVLERPRGPAAERANQHNHLQPRQVARRRPHDLPRESRPLACPFRAKRRWRPGPGGAARRCPRLLWCWPSACNFGSPDDQ
jgi:hypothetical protein